MAGSALKRHGLWRFHRLAKVALKHGVRWWVEDEAPRVHRLIQATYIGYGGKIGPSNADALIACAKRYIRRYNIRCVTVEQWNDLIERLADRSGFDHHSTMRAALIQKCSKKVRLDWERPLWAETDKQCESIPPSPKWSNEEIKERLDRMKAFKWRKKKEEEKRLQEQLEDQREQRWKSLCEIAETKQAVADINRAIKSAQAAMKERFA